MSYDHNLCPECGGKMKSRLNAKTQQRFWGCARYPACTGRRDTDGRAQAPTRSPRTPTAGSWE